MYCAAVGVFECGIKICFRVVDDAVRFNHVFPL